MLLQGTDLVLKRSEDGGLTWSPLTVFFSNSTDNETNVIGNAAPVQDKSTGRIWMPFNRNNEQVFMSYSEDDGVTWSQPVYHPELVHEDWKWVGLGPPAGLQLSTGRLLVPGYHTIKLKGDGLLSRGHTLYSDDHGVTWAIGSEDFGGPYLSNECQAVELSDGSVLINARTVTNQRVQVLSKDGGLTFGPPSIAEGLIQPLEGCEGSMVYDVTEDRLFFSDPANRSLVRQNMTVFQSIDHGASWQPLLTVDTGAVAYSALQMVYEYGKSGLALLYERSEVLQLVFEPDQIVFYRVF